MDELVPRIYEKRHRGYNLAARQPARKLFVGVDEAGYGPNLGPLLIGGSAWVVPAEMTETELCTLLAAEQFCTAAWSPNCDHVPLGDSKKLYQSTSGLRTLELGLFSMLATLGNEPRKLGDSLGKLDQFVERLAPAASTHKAGDTNCKVAPWYLNLGEFSVPVTEAAEPETVRLGDLAKRRLQKHGIELVAVNAMVIDEAEFNRQVLQYDSKGKLLSLVTFEMVDCLLDASPELPAEIYCDRQGGRKNYMPLLLEWMPESWFIETQQSNARCSYRTTIGRNLDIHFSVGGDSFPPTALASMVAKYLRERLMESFNHYWNQQVPGTKPTAGYPQDAIRFRKLIEAKAAELGLPLEIWWRSR